jgi:hypothetical protein
MLSSFIPRALQSPALGCAACETSTGWIIDVRLVTTQPSTTSSLA